MTKITVKYEGDGAFEDPEHESGLVPQGGTFETTKTRLKELQEQGFDVVQVEGDTSAASAPATSAKEKS